MLPPEIAAQQIIESAIVWRKIVDQTAAYSRVHLRVLSHMIDLEVRGPMAVDAEEYLSLTQNVFWSREELLTLDHMQPIAREDIEPSANLIDVHTSSHVRVMPPWQSDRVVARAQALAFLVDSRFKR
jgi:hypothetical protein